MSENLTEQTEIDTTGLKPVHEGFSELVTANKQNTSNVIEKGVSGVVDANKQNSDSSSNKEKDS